MKGAKRKTVVEIKSNKNIGFIVFVQLSVHEQKNMGAEMMFIIERQLEKIVGESYRNFCGTPSFVFSSTINIPLFKKLQESLENLDNIFDVDERIIPWKKEGRSNKGTLSILKDDKFSEFYKLVDYQQNTPSPKEEHPSVVVLKSIANECNMREEAMKKVEELLLNKQSNEEDFDIWVEFLEKLVEHEWFYGCITDKLFEKAEKKLLKTTDIGSFFVYFSRSECGVATLLRNTGEDHVQALHYESWDALECEVDGKGMSRYDSGIFVYNKKF